MSKLMRLAMLIDLDRCTGCNACTVACKWENNVELGAFWLRVHQIGPIGEFPNHMELYYLPLTCQHCQDPCCVGECPTDALYKREDGIVLIDEEKCTGCGNCVNACPYGAYSFNEEKVVGKCNLCSHLIDHGERPACAKTCVVQAIVVGDIDDPNSEISQKVREAGDKTYTLRLEINTKPSVYYTLRKQTWRGFDNKWKITPYEG
ncbi:4Fe-4S dicluster domain-containing protein [Chloroflexota bacterium]